MVRIFGGPRDILEWSYEVFVSSSSNMQASIPSTQWSQGAISREGTMAIRTIGIII